MSNLLNLLQDQLSEGALDAFTSQMGGGNRQATQTAANGILTTLTAALSKNASTPEGASSLLGALENDHDGGILDNVMDLISGSGNVTQSRAANGAGILKHILGSKQQNATDMISKMSGLDKGNVMNMMMKMAPMVMGMLGRQKKEQGLDVNGLSGLLSGTVQSARQNNTEMSLVEKFLDARR